MNYYKKIAEMLGVELEEEFKVSDMKIFTFKFTENDGLMFKYGTNEDYMPSSLILTKLLRGDYSVVKLPWKPKKGEVYWYYSEAFQHAFASEWIGSLCDLLYWKSGNLFKTKKEANEKGYVFWKELEKEYEKA